MSDYNHTKGDMANDTTQIKDMPDKVTYENLFDDSSDTIVFD